MRYENWEGYIFLERKPRTRLLSCMRDMRQTSCRWGSRLTQVYYLFKYFLYCYILSFFWVKKNIKKEKDNILVLHTVDSWIDPLLETPDWNRVDWPLSTEVTYCRPKKELPKIQKCSFGLLLSCALLVWSVEMMWIWHHFAASGQWEEDIRR
jgi:hypothetical protein